MKITHTYTPPSTFHLRSAILLYEATTPAQHNMIAVEHDILASKHTPMLGPGRFVTADFVTTLLEQMSVRDLTYIPEHVIATARNAVAWFEPAAIRPLYFAPRVHNDDAVRPFDNCAIPQPPLLFVAKNHQLYVYALADNTRPTHNSTLYYAPYFNIFDDQRVCIGSMTIPKHVDPANTASWSDAFFRSEFTHLTGSKRWLHPGTYAEMLTDLRTREHFPSEWLKPLATTVGEALCTN
jgi:PRTRC genetic system protein B